MDERERTERAQDPTESGALEPETEGDLVEPPAAPHEQPAESGGLEDDEAQ